MLRFNGVEDLKGFKIKQLIPKGAFNCVLLVDCFWVWPHRRRLGRTALPTVVSCVFVLVATNEEVKDMTKLPLNDLLGYLRTYEMHLDIDSKDISMHNNDKDDSDDDFIYSNEEVSYEEL
ncbi:hypothetical protein M9H77_03240 [Catharanthus roseus]|uniref:Uncharacterized protein n=1 Tax=Catharanthus roseus TaxID=4058 RepID=A0ACC0CAN2_CATRO|nr:hypothetical protein M9H77_03240 [Catharanthus roseus]